jgi:hypothetical protein
VYPDKKGLVTWFMLFVVDCEQFDLLLKLFFLVKYNDLRKHLIG